MAGEIEGLLALALAGVQFGQQQQGQRKWKRGAHRMRDILNSLAQQSYATNSPLISKAVEKAKASRLSTMKAGGGFSPEAGAKITGEMDIDLATTLAKLKTDLTQGALSQYYGFRHGGGEPQMPDLASAGIGALSAFNAAQPSAADKYFDLMMTREKNRQPLAPAMPNMDWV